MNTTQQLLEKMARRRAELARKDEQNTLDMIKRRARKDGGSKHSISAWLGDKLLGMGDYDCGEASPRQTSNY
jgi:hypothetical protein